MEHLGYTEAQLRSAGAYWTAREIAQQPQLWADLHEGATAAPGADADFVARLLDRTSPRVVLTGAGTSAFVGDCLAPALRRALRCRADAIATTDLVTAPESFLAAGEPLLLVSFARSGNSPESVAAVDLAETIAAPAHHLVITCNADGALAVRARSLPSACVTLLPERANDRSFAMTSSFSSMLLAAALALGASRARPGAEVAHAAGAALALALPFGRSLAAQRFERIVYLGSAELKGLASEAALKMLELSDGRTVATADSVLGFRHGPKTIINNRTLVVVFRSHAPYRRAYERDLLRELRRDAVAGRVIAIDSSPSTDDGGGDTLQLPAVAGTSELDLVFPYALFAQVFAFLQSLALGLQPDVPNAAGTVSRVVQGVSIHPWAPPR